jgi:hypothetical protein
MRAMHATRQQHAALARGAGEGGGYFRCARAVSVPQTLVPQPFSECGERVEIVCRRLFVGWCSSVRQKDLTGQGGGAPRRWGQQQTKTPEILHLPQKETIPGHNLAWAMQNKKQSNMTVCWSTYLLPSRLVFLRCLWVDSVLKYRENDEVDCGNRHCGQGTAT